MRSRQRRRVNWSDLPLEILRLIAEFLVKSDSSLDNFRHFRAVCKKWLISTAITTLLPHHINSTPPQTLFSTTVYLLRPRGGAAVNSSPVWLIAAAETTDGNPQQLRHLFSGNPLLNVPADLNFDHFHSTRLAVGFHLSGDDNDFDKVLISSTKRLPSISDCAVLGLHDGGKLGGYPPFGDEIDDEDEDVDEDEDEVEFPWVEVSYRSLSYFDDVVNYKGMICALDRRGKLYEIDINTLRVRSVLIDHPLSSSSSSKKGWRKRLVVSPRGKLYMVAKEEVNVNVDVNVRKASTNFKVYKLSKEEEEEEEKWCWVEVKGVTDRVLFVTRDYCFFVASSVFSLDLKVLRNCIVFSECAFPAYSNTSCGWKLPERLGRGEEEEIRVWKLGEDGGDLQSVLSYPGLRMMLSSLPPYWVFESPTSSSISQSQSRRESEEHEQVQRETNSNYNGPFQPELLDLTDEISSISSQWKTMRTPTINHVVAKKETPREEIIHSITRAYITSLTQSSKGDTSTVTFKGLNIRSSLVPTMQKIWSKHGNIIENSIICNGDLIARALESLATAVLILEGNSARSLDDAQAEYLSSTLSDLKCMRLKVDWLVSLR